MLNIIIPEEKTNETPTSLISELKSLGTISDSITSNEPVLLSQVDDKIKQKKKNKNKKKKNSGFDEFKSIMEEIIADDEDDIRFMDIDDVLYDDEYEEEDIEGSIIGTQRGNYGKLKKAENIYKKEFAEELTLLYNLLDETNKYSKKLEKKFDALENSKARGVSKYTTDIATNIMQGKNAKLHIIKEISSIKKIIADLQLKADSKKAAAEGATGNNDLLASSYLQNIIKHGRSSFIDTLTKSEIPDTTDVPSWDPTSDDSGTYDRYEDVIEERLSNETNKYRDSKEGDTYIKYENLGVKIIIRRNISSGEWDIVALDKNNQIVYDYPIPDKNTLGKIKFTEDGSYASDKYGRSYKVLEIYDE